MRRKPIFSIIIIALILTIGILYGINKTTDVSYQTLDGKVFGTYYSVKIATESLNPNVQQDIVRTLEQINNRMSIFEPYSEISQINRSPANIPLHLSRQMALIMQTSAKINHISKGAFDPTVGKLVELWGFGTQNNPPIPTPKKIAETLSYSGFDKLEFNPDYSELKKKDSRTFLNLSAIAKGYAVDKIAELLDLYGYKNYLVDIGGEMRVSGHLYGYKNYLVDIGGEMRVSGQRDDKSNGWNIGVAVPQKQSKDNLFAMSLSNIAVATSGDYQNFTYYEGKKIAHAISPQTGYPVSDRLASVTVLDKSCMQADAYATGLLVLGFSKGLQLAEENHIPAIFHFSSDAKFLQEE